MSTVPNWPWPQPVIATAVLDAVRLRLGVGTTSSSRGLSPAKATAHAADGSGDSAELARGHDLPHEREGTGLLVGELPDQPGPQPGQQLAEPYRVGVHGERVVDHGL